MDIELRNESGILTVALSGNLNTSTAPELMSALDGALENVTDLILDLTEVNYLSSAGVRVILFAYRNISAVSGSLRLIGVQPEVYRIFEITCLTDSLDITRA